MDEELKTRLNELAKKKKTEGLSSAEQDEQTRLYRIYIDELKGQLKHALDKEGFKLKSDS